MAKGKAESAIPFEVVDALYAAIGIIASAWSIFERWIDTAIWELAGLDKETGACLTSQIQSVRAKLITVEALAHLKGASPETLKDLRRFTNDTEGPTRRRNMVIHNPIEEVGIDITLRIVSANRMLIFDNHPITHDDVTALHKDIMKLIGRFKAMFSTLGLKSFPSP